MYFLPSIKAQNVSIHGANIFFPSNEFVGNPFFVLNYRVFILYKGQDYGISAEKIWKNKGQL